MLDKIDWRSDSWIAGFPDPAAAAPAPPGAGAGTGTVVAAGVELVEFVS